MTIRKSVCLIDGCAKPVFARQWCNAHYKRWYRYGDPLTISENYVVGKNKKMLTFVKSASKSNTDECIIWPNKLNAQGYGVLTYQGSLYPAHRLSLIMAKGEPPTPKHHAAHAPVICHNRSCINPLHLRWATARENIMDMVEDGTQPRGQKSPKAKITREIVIAIRADSRGQDVIGKQYSISGAQVSRIRNRKSWAWL